MRTGLSASAHVGLLTGVSSGVGGALSLVVWAIVSRHVPGSTFGILTSVISIANIAVMVGTAGEEHACARYGVGGSGPSVRHVVARQALTVMFVMALGTALLGPTLTPEGRFFAGVLAPSAVMATGLRTAAALERRRNLYGLTYLSNSLAVPAPRIAAWVTMYVLGSSFSLVGFGGLSSVWAALGLGGLLWCYGRRQPSSVRQQAWACEDVTRSGWSSFARHWRAHSIAQALLAWADIPLVAVVVGPEAAGLYGFASRLAIGPRFLTTGLGVWYAANRQRSNGCEREEYERVRRMGTAGCLAASALIATAAPSIFGYAGLPMTRSAVAVLVLVFAAAVVDAGFGPNAWELGYSSGSRFVAQVEWLSVALDMAGILVLAPRFGIGGAAAAWLLAMTAGNVVRTRRMRVDSGLIARRRS